MSDAGKGSNTAKRTNFKKFWNAPIWNKLKDKNTGSNKYKD